MDNKPELVATKRGAAKLGFAVMLRFYTERGRFPRGRAEIAFYDFTGSHQQGAPVPDPRGAQIP